MNGQSLAALALRCGADKAALVRGQDIVLSEEFRRLCEDNACGFYGKCWMCPPDAGDIHTLMARVRTYDGGVLYQIVCPLEDSFDIEGMSEAGRRHALLSQKIQAALTREERAATWHLSCGGCRVSLKTFWGSPLNGKRATRPASRRWITPRSMLFQPSLAKRTGRSC